MFWTQLTKYQSRVMMQYLIKLITSVERKISTCSSVMHTASTIIQNWKHVANRMFGTLAATELFGQTGQHSCLDVMRSLRHDDIPYEIPWEIAGKACSLFYSTPMRRKTEEETYSHRQSLLKLVSNITQTYRMQTIHRRIFDFSYSIYSLFLETHVVFTQKIFVRIFNSYLILLYDTMFYLRYKAR